MERLNQMMVLPKIAFININGIASKVDKIKQYMNSNKNNVDILCIVETWLREDDKVAFRPIVADVRCDRMVGSRGSEGIMILAKDSISREIQVRKIDDSKRWIRLEIASTLTLIVAYHPPSMTEEEVKRFWEEMDVIMSDREKEVILVGDFNARMSKVTGDSTTNSRGRWLEGALAKGNINRVAPSLGKWTTIRPNGKGITDLVLTSRYHTDVVKDFIVTDNNMGTSDHRVLEITLNGTLVIDEEDTYQRWDVIKLKKAEIKAHYETLLQNTHHIVREAIDNQWKYIKEIKRRKLYLPIEEREEIANELWDTFKGWIQYALTRSCGKYKRKFYTNPHFLTDQMKELQKQRDRAKVEAEEAVINNATSDVIKEKWRTFGRLSSKWKKRYCSRKQVVFQRSMDLLDYPDERTTFIKMVSALKKRETRQKSMLDTNKMEEHKIYFNTTFGGSPEGADRFISEDVLLETNNRNSIIPKISKGWSVDRIKHMLANTLNGKAAGIDSLSGEMFKSAGDYIEVIILYIFRILETLIAIPNEWKVAKINPVYKGKGDKYNITNYRPIAITVVMRRMYEQFIGRHHLPLTRLLQSNQGGFRNSRSTLDQVARLHELLVDNKSMIVSFLDIKAAFDCVDRRILWTELTNEWKMKKREVAVLRSLFDDNSCILVINGKESTAIPHRRGLLQGSTLSPGLFNFYIDTLIQQLNKLKNGLPEGNTLCNNLFFADDGALIAKNELDAKIQLSICESWSAQRGIAFSPSKCATLRKNVSNRGVYIYNELLEDKEYFTYLGIVIGRNGINWDKSMTKRIETATNRIYWMRRQGMNSYGWRTKMNLAIYKSFIRPMIEYGFALQLLPASVMAKLQRVQNLALRCIFSTHKSTSVATMHNLLGLESMKHRNIKLNAKYMDMIINGRKRSLPIGEIIVARLGKLSTLKAKTITYSFVNGSPLQRHVLGGFGVSKLQYELMRLKDIDSMKLNGGKVSVRLIVNNDKKCRIDNLLCNYNKLPRSTLHILTQWKLGRIGTHDKCKNCNSILTRQHFLTCSNIRLGISNALRYTSVKKRQNEALDLYMDRCLAKLDAESDRDRVALTKIAEYLYIGKQVLTNWSHNNNETFSDDEDPNEKYNVLLRNKERQLTLKKYRRRIRIRPIQQRNQAL